LNQCVIAQITADWSMHTIDQWRVAIKRTHPLV